MKIASLSAVPGLTGYYSDDNAAIKADGRRDGFLYSTGPVTPGFRATRQPGEALLLALVLEDGQVALGDCATPQFAGSGGREAPLVASEARRLIEQEVAPALLHKEFQGFAAASRALEDLRAWGQRLPEAITFGLSQAFLDAAALSRRCTMAEVICLEYGLAMPTAAVPLMAQADDLRLSVDKMILKQVAMLPHGVINNVKQDVGPNGCLLLEYVAWIRQRIQTIGAPGYSPTLHLDLYGTVGLAFENDLSRIVRYIGALEQAARPFPLLLETPLDMGAQQAQVEAMQRLRERLRSQGSSVRLVVDEWCNSPADVQMWVATGAADLIHINTMVFGALHNTVEAALWCKERGVGVLISGGCNMTDIAARAETNVALATRANGICAAPGMGVDEGLMIMFNEMQRVLALSATRRLEREAGYGVA